MSYRTLRECVFDLEKNGHLVRVKEQVDPDLEMAAIHLRVHAANGPAILFENVKGCSFPAVSNLFGTMERSRFIFRSTLENVKRLIKLKSDPMKILKHPLQNLGVMKCIFNALPQKSYSSCLTSQISINQLPQIKSWPQDGGAFITLPQVYSEDIGKPGFMNSNLGMYRIQLSGNDYVHNKEIGLHFQIHRGIGVHQAKAKEKGNPLKVSVFIGGPPAHAFAAVMPLPEGMSELTFAGALAGRRFRYYYENGYLISADADFVITGDVIHGETKTEGPFGDHLGYYSLKHNFPLIRVQKVYHRKNAIYPFTVVGRPPQEDSYFGALIHEITGSVIPDAIPGLHQVNAVDAAGVHPLLLAIGSERYTPFLKERKPQEILTIANHILGFGQMSLAKYLFIAAKEDQPDLNANNIEGFFSHILERVDFTRDLHFQTNTTIDTLDYSGTGLNNGSKLVIAAAGDRKRVLGKSMSDFTIIDSTEMLNAKVVIPGVLAIQIKRYSDEKNAANEIGKLISQISPAGERESGRIPNAFPLIVLVDDADFTAKTLRNFLWVSFTRSNPSHDVYGAGSFTEHKHWSCTGPLIIDARIKPHHSPVLEPDPEIERKVDQLGLKGKSLYGILD